MALYDKDGNEVLPAQEGTDGTGITQPTGGAGIRGWLSGIFQKVSLGATATKQDEQKALVGAINDSAVIDPTATGSVIALLKGLIKQLQGDGTAGKAAPVSLSGSKVEECQDQDDADANVLTFAANISALEIYHNEATAQEFTVNGLTLTIASGGWRSPIGGTPAATVTIPAGVDCIVSRLV